MSERLWYLKNCDLFERLSEGELSRLEGRSRIRHFRPKSPVYLPADQADGILLVGEGRVKISSFTPDGKQSILAFIEPGELFGELAMVESGMREEQAEATENTTIVLIPATEMLRLVETYPRISLGVTKLIGLRRKRIERRLKYLLFHSNRERLVHLLLELTEQYGKTTDQGVELAIKLSHQDLANIIGSTRETVTVILGELQNEKLVAIARRRVVVTDIQKLAATVQRAAPTIDQPATSSPTISSLNPPGRRAGNTI